MTNTAYLPIEPTKEFNLEHKYLAMFQQEGTHIPFIADSSDSVNEVANMCEDRMISDRKLGKKRRYYFTPSECVRETIPFPGLKL